MSESRATDQGPALQLHQVWFMVLKPRAVVLANGLAAYDALGQYESMLEASSAVRNLPGGMIVMNAVLFINPTAPLPGILRNN